MIYYFLHSSNLKIGSSIWNNKGYYIKKKERFLFFAEKKKNKISLKSNPNSRVIKQCFKISYIHRFSNFRNLLLLATVFLIQLGIPTYSFGVTCKESIISETEKTFFNQKEGNENKNKFLLAEHQNIGNSDLPILQKASDLLKEMDHHVSRPVKDALILL